MPAYKCKSPLLTVSLKLCALLLCVCHVWVCHWAAAGPVNPLWCGSVLPPSGSCSRANGGAPLPPLRSILSGSGPFLRGMNAEEPLEREGRGQLATSQTLDSGEEAHFSVPLRWSFAASWRISLEKEDMDFARRVWLSRLLKPEELNSGNDAVVSYVSRLLL